MSAVRTIAWGMVDTSRLSDAELEELRNIINVELAEYRLWVPPFHLGLSHRLLTDKGVCVAAADLEHICKYVLEHYLGGDKEPGNERDTHHRMGHGRPSGVDRG